MHILGFLDHNLHGESQPEVGGQPTQRNGGAGGMSGPAVL